MRVLSTGFLLHFFQKLETNSTLVATVANEAGNCRMDWYVVKATEYHPG